ncbi:putative nitrogen fixation protein NifT [Pantoea cypripedii]|uniref:Putative nitrogen fixation protein NifT n=1 Tax=Pantoea cypripedii TaxID=55209 RepID=A0A1X1EK86_PANCY|nr:putative nitrogen fixation protein NifT [Pantoea cypripedii]MBP2198908.1 nitrogen fixation protein NifT [Pantoea cypripedii]ORM89351.1 putative nitrogen fixation protein NifT [Pantoea cypripedii]
MPMVIFRRRGADLYCYIAKQDLEAKVIAVEHDTPERWGGAVSLEGGRRYFVSEQPGRPDFPVSLRASRDAQN